MAVSITDLTAWRDALVKARLSGITSVRDQNGEQVIYRSDAEMARAIAAAEAMIAAVSTPITTIRFNTSKGF